MRPVKRLQLLREINYSTTLDDKMVKNFSSADGKNGVFCVVPCDVIGKASRKSCKEALDKKSASPARPLSARRCDADVLSTWCFSWLTRTCHESQEYFTFPVLCHATKLQRIAQSLQASLGQEGRYVQPLTDRYYDADVLST